MTVVIVFMILPFLLAVVPHVYRVRSMAHVFCTANRVSHP